MLLIFPLLTLLISFASAITLNLTDSQSIRQAAAIAAHGLQAIYNGNQSGGVLGKFPYPPYYWWESGGAWGGMITYAHFTGDHSYNNVTYQALLSQLGPALDFNMPIEAFDEGNDDQAFWVFAAMSAAEYGFEEPPPPIPGWMQICDNAFNDYISRWNMITCGGGLQWQFNPANAGFYYKNAISNGAFFQLAARLGRFTGNQTYLDWANKIWSWSSAIGLIDPNYNVYDGTDDTTNCTSIDHNQWSYNIAVYLYGAAVMQNYTNASTVWVERTAGLLDAVSAFLTPYPNATDIIFELQCETQGTCDVDQYSFKAFLARWLAETSMLAPFTAARVGAILQASALGASSSCTGGPYDDICGAKWYINGYDGTAGLGQQLSAMEVFYALLVNETSPPNSLGNVHIRSEPTTTISISAEPTMSATAFYQNSGFRLSLAPFTFFDRNFFIMLSNCLTVMLITT